jgi:magnesium transporter
MQPDAPAGRVTQVKRRRSRKRRAMPPPGTAPGTLNIDPGAPRPVIHLIAYGPDGLTETAIDDVDKLPAMIGAHPVNWINVDGLGDEGVLTKLAAQFHVHRLALEDVVNTNQRAKIEHYPDQLFMVAHQIHTDDGISTEQLSLFLGPNYLLTFQERSGDAFDPVRKRIREGRGRMRQAGPGYLAYTLLDAVVDFYFPVLERFGEELDVLEDEVLYHPHRGTIARIHHVKRELLVLRRSMWPLRDALHALLRDETPLFQPEDRYYLQDCYDHTMRVLEMVDTFREVGSGLLDVYLSSVSNRMNEIMKVLTMFASIFIPLSFIAGLYGMNFDPSRSRWNMPELAWRYGYPFALSIMAAVAGGLLLYFRRKGWLGGDSPDQPAERPDREPPGESSQGPPGGAPRA